MRILRLAVLLLFLRAVPADAATAARPLATSGRGYGARITLSLPNSVYQREEWIDAAVRVRNVSRRPIYVNGYPQTCWTAGYNGANPVVVEQTAGGRTIYPPKARHVVACNRPVPFPVMPGRSVRQMIYAPARAPYLFASVLLKVRGKHGKLTAVRIRTPRVRIKIR